MEEEVRRRSDELAVAVRPVSTRGQEGGQRRGCGVQGHAAAMAGCGGISTRGRRRSPVEVALRRRGARRTESDRVL